MEFTREVLRHGTGVYVSGRHRFGADAMLLSGFARPRWAERAVDLCSGCGIVALRWHDLGHRGPCLAVEKEPEAAALLARAVAEDPELGHIRPLCADLNDLAGDGLAHLAAANPPYFSGGLVSPDPVRAAARHEGGCTLEQVAAAAARCLRDGGRFALCHRPEQLARVFAALAAARLEPKRLVFVKQRAQDAPWLFLLEAQKNRRPGLRLAPDVLMEDAGGRPSAQLQKIYREGM